MLAHTFIINRCVYRTEAGAAWVGGNFIFQAGLPAIVKELSGFSRDPSIVNPLSAISSYRVLCHISRQALDVPRHGPHVVRDRNSCRQITP